MKVYFEKTNGGKQVIMTDGETAKVFGAAPTGIFEGIDLYTEDAEEQLKKHFEEAENAGELNGYDEMYSEIEIDFDEALADELEEAILIFEN